MKIFISCIFFLSGNLIYQLFFTEPKWDVAVDRIVFQAIGMAWMFYILRYQFNEKR